MSGDFRQTDKNRCNNRFYPCEFRESTADVVNFESVVFDSLVFQAYVVVVSAHPLSIQVGLKADYV